MGKSQKSESDPRKKQKKLGHCRSFAITLLIHPKSRSFDSKMNGGLQLVSLLFLHALTLVASSGAGDQWNYDGSGGIGKNDWSKKEQWKTCGGKSQSPIDIKSDSNLPQKEFKPFIFHGYDSTFEKTKLENNGHSVKMSITKLYKAQPQPGVSGGDLDGKYNFAQYHMHWGSDSGKGSEHKVNSKAYPMELHLVHYKASLGDFKTAAGSDAKDALAVLGIFFEIQDEDNTKLQPLIEAVRAVQGDTKDTKMEQMELKDFLPRNTDQFYRYQGGLTTPGCNEIVVWTVFKQPIGISENQMKVIRGIYEGSKNEGKRILDNFRDPQPLNGRQVFDVDTSVKKFTSGASSITFCMSLIILVLSRVFFH